MHAEKKIEGALSRQMTIKYGPLGRKIEKWLEGTDNGNTWETTITYTYDGEDVVYEEEGEPGQPNHTNRFVHGPGIDEVLAFTRDGQVNYVHADHQGSTVARTDIYGTVTKGYLYNSFGVPADQGFDPYHYTYTGREWDNIFKIFYYRARYYDPAAGRFLSKDPIGFAGGDVNLFAYVDTVGKPTLETNLYTYTGNNPINRTDPLGLWYIDINLSVGFWGGITGGIIIGPEGIYTYGGGGLVSPPGGIAVTVSPSDPSPGWNVGFQAGYWAGFQYGYSLRDSSTFWEVGFVTPGFGGTGYNVSEPWKWPWERDEEEACN